MKKEEIKERKIIISIELSAKGVICVRGKVIGVKIPENMRSK